VHPIVAQVSPSEEQRPAVLVHGCDVVITAGAGTGKTRTLVARYLALLAEGMPLRAIVAVTFTRKAAREMRNRIREEVRRYLSRPDLEAEERQRWLTLYSELDAARIGTIHSLCVEILRAHPAEARLDPRFDVLEGGQLSILGRQALDEALTWAADNAETAQLFPLLGEQGLRDVLQALLNQRLDARLTFARVAGNPLGVWQEALEAEQARALARLFEDETWRSAVAVLRDNVASKQQDRIEIQRRAALAAIDEATGMISERWASLSHLADLNLTGGSRRAWPSGREQLDEVKGALRALRDLWKAVKKRTPAAMNDLDVTVSQHLPMLGTLFAFACERYDALKRDRHCVDFDDLEEGALRLLRENPAVRSRWQREIQAILVDEFQDTNSRQRDLLQLLNGQGGKLFLVGDAKQSIYRFRGADVTVFRAERDRIEREGGVAFSLRTSYRARLPCRTRPDRA